MQDKKKWGDKTETEKMGRRDVRPKKNEETRRKTKKNGEPRRKAK